MMDPRIIAVVTGTRAEYGLLRPAMRAIKLHSNLELRVVVMGTHLLEPTLTVREVEHEFQIHAKIEMQHADVCGRLADASALGRGVTGMADYLAEHPPDVVLVLGDRIEAFAAAAAASVAGFRVAHLHGGDRAEGIADEALRHAITKLAHIHLAATANSAERLINMGETPAQVHLVGSPAIDGLSMMPPMADGPYASLGSPNIVFMLHPSGLTAEEDWANTERLLRICKTHGNVLALHPNFDHGREGILEAVETSGCRNHAHLPREQFIGLLRRAKCLVGNSSAGLIESAALAVPCINVGTRQAGRDMPDNVIDVADWDFGAVDMALEDIFGGCEFSTSHPYGDGTAGPKTAEVLAAFNPELHPLIKHNSY